MGAGLSGLVAASELVTAGYDVTVVEARDRVGGRLMTVSPDGGGAHDVGATWHWEHQPHVRALADRLGLRSFPQPAEGTALHETDNGGAPAEVAIPADGARRFAGGTQHLCQGLADRLPEGTVSLGRRVSAVVAGDEGISVSLAEPDGSTSPLGADAVVVALPPRLVLQNIAFTPGLPVDVLSAMAATPTWMGEALKCVAVYDEPFWRDQGRSGTAFSDIGPLAEVHDATEPGGPPALWGFVAQDLDWRAMEPAQRVPAVLAQLGRLFGPLGADPAQYFERDWSADPNTCEDEHRHGPVLPYGDSRLAAPLWDGRLVWAGTETAAEGGGHMEGAVVAGRRAARLVAAGTVSGA